MTRPPARRPVDVYIGAGSNIDPAAHLCQARDALAGHFGPLAVSPVYRTKAVGFDGDDFLNAVFAFSSCASPRNVVAVLDEIERLAGRRKPANSFTPRSLDLDLLLYGDLVCDEPGLKLPRDDITRYAFVLAPLADLAPDLVHPVTGARIRDLWAAHGGGDEGLRQKMDFAALGNAAH